MNWIKKHKFLTIIGAIVLIALLSSALGSKPAETTKQSPSPAASQASATPAPAKVSLDEFYAQVANGQSKEQVNALAGGRTPSNCSETQSEYVGKMETCNYGGFRDGGLVTVMFTNDKVTSKSNSKF